MRQHFPIESLPSESPSDESDYTGSADNGAELDTDLSNIHDRQLHCRFIDYLNIWNRHGSLRGVACRHEGLVYRPITPTSRMIDIRMQQAVALEDKQVLLLIRAYPNMLRLDNSGLDLIQKLPDFAQVIDDLRSLVWAVANE